MIFRYTISFLALASVLFFSMPAAIASSLQLSDDGVQVIPLSAVGHERANSVAYSPDGKLIAVGTSSGIFIFNSETLTQERFISAGSWVRSVAFSTDSQNLAGSLFDNTARLWRVSDGVQLRAFEGHESWVRSLALSQDGQLLATASDDNTVRLWNAGDGSPKLIIDSLEGVRVLAISPDSQTIAIGLQNNNIQLRETSDGSLLRTFSGHTAWVRCLAFSPDGHTLASGAFDATARLWDVESGQLKHTLDGHQSSVLGIAFSPDGAVLATGSVDETVRLWNAGDGGLDRVLAGHDSFVYSVAFSPDGQALVSGADDNTIRVWDLRVVSDNSENLPTTPSDCRVCHHPVSTANPPAVIEVRCDACHVGGAGLNWCPNFPRSLKNVSGAETSSISINKTGVSVPSESLAVTIFNPANGETLYTRSEYIAAVQVTGRVEGYSHSLEDVEVRLEIWADSVLVSSLTKLPLSNGTFNFSVGINREGKILLTNDPTDPIDCGTSCHIDSNVESYLPTGDVHLVVVAKTKEGEEAKDERWITADVGQAKTIEVRVNDAASGKPIPGLNIQAFTKFYEWRGRNANDVSDANGIVALNLETLSQASTAYEISIPDQVVNGIFYSSQKTETAVFAPHAMDKSYVTVEVHAQKGQIEGQLTNDSGPLPGSVTIWAFGLPAGPSFHVKTTRDGSFSLTDLPISEYIVFPDPEITGSHDLKASQHIVDLTQLPSSDVVIELYPDDSLVLNGEVNGLEGEWLPFAWLTSPEQSVYQIDPESGNWTVGNVPLNRQSWVASAPGYFSQEIDLSNVSSTTGLSIVLERRSDVDVIAWGDGEIVIPGETEAIVGKDRIDFEYGWVWGSGHNAQPFILETSAAEIRISGGRFALQRLPGEIAWFFLFDGQAELHSEKTREIITLQSGNMIALLERDTLAEVPYAPAQLLALGTANETPVNPTWKPSVAQGIQSQLSKAGISTAQMVTFITYIIAISALGVMPLLALRWWLKRRKVHGEKNE